MIDREVMDRMVVRAEQGAHRQGWDCPPVLLFGWDHGNIQSLEPVPGVVSHPPLTGFMTYLADNFEQRSNIITQLMRGRSAKPFLGFGLVHEGLAKIIDRTGRDDEDVKREVQQSLKRRLMDQPGSIDVRQLTMVDVWGRCYSRIRQRGSKPLPDLKKIGIQGGTLMLAIARMTRAVVRTGAVTGGDLGALDTLIDQWSRPASEIIDQGLVGKSEA